MKKPNICLVWVFVCKLIGGCGTVIKIRSDSYDGHCFIKCPVCSRNAELVHKEY